MKFDVITFGSAVLDVFVLTPAAKVIRTDRVETDRALVFPYGSKCEVERLVIGSGGGGTNTAVGFARLGLKAAVVARCGWDFAGKIIRQELKKEGVDDSFLAQLEKEETDYSTILIGPDGGRTILVYRGGTRLEKRLIDLKKLQAKWFYTSSLEGNLDLLAKLVDQARRNGIRIASNPGRREISQKERLLSIARKLDILIVNQEEASQLIGRLVNDYRSFDKIASLLPKTMVVITLGSRGVVVYHPKKGRYQADGLKVKMADSTGAGDGFGCGLVAGLVQNWPLAKALQLGVANGAAAVTKIGAKQGLIKKEAVGLWLEKAVKIKKG